MKVAAVLRKKGRHVHTIHPAATVVDAADALAGSEIGALVVTIAAGDVVGIGVRARPRPRTAQPR